MASKGLEMLEKLRALRQWPRQKPEPSPTDNIIWLRPDVFRGDRLSFASVLDERGFRDWHRSVVQSLGRDDASYVCDLKPEGIGATLIYEDGMLVEAIPQADSPDWRAITRQLRAIEGVPLTISRDGALKRLEVLCALYPGESSLRASVHGIAHTEGGSVPGNHWAELSYLKNLGFSASPHSRLARAPEDVIEYYGMWLAKRDELGYDCDGIVVKVNRRDYQRELGYAGGQARWAVTYKFPGSSLEIEREPPYLLPKTGAAALQQPAPLSGLRFLVAGESEGSSRLQIDDMLKELGGTICESISEAADFLIIGDDASELLMAQARQMGIRAVPIREFLRYYHALRLSSRLDRLVNSLDRL